MPQSGQASFSENVFLATDDGDGDEAAGKLQRGGNGLLEARGDSRFDKQAVDDDFDGVVLALINDRQIVERKKFTIDSGADVSHPAQIFELFPVGAFSAANDGAEDHDAIIMLRDFAVQNGLDDLLTGLSRDGLAAVRAMRNANGGIRSRGGNRKFRDGSNRGTRRAVVVFCSMAIDGESPR